MSEPEVGRPLPFLRAARGVFDLTLEAMVWSRRGFWMALLLGLPVLLAVLYRFLWAVRLQARINAFDLYGQLVVLYYIGTVLPLVALFYATALVADEVEGKTITYLFTRPIPRPAILAGKFASYLAATVALTLPPLVITFLVLVPGGRDSRSLAAAVPDLLRDSGVVTLTLLAYGSLFTLLGVVLRRPLIPGLLFVFVWEWASRLPGYLPRFTLAAYLRSLVSHRPPEEGLVALLSPSMPPAALSLAVLFAVAGLFLWAALWIFSRRDYVLEQ